MGLEIGVKWILCGDVIYFAQANPQPDGKQYVEAIVKEVNGHMENENWCLIKRNEVPDFKHILQSVIEMQPDSSGDCEAQGTPKLTQRHAGVWC